MLTQGVTKGNKAMKALPAPNDTESQMSETSANDFFVTGAKVTYKGKKGADPDSPTAVAARALMLFNNKDDEGLEQ